jgi:D-alanyl-D-alanine carboxypeptidase
MRAISYLFSSIIFLSCLQLNAAKLNTQCTKNPVTGVVEGLNANTSYTIASVSKIFTTHWAVSQLGADYRYPILIHVTPVAAGQIDVHMEGSLFPYFDRTMFQFLIGELNKLGVKAIHYLTYDENLLYASDVRTNALLAHGDYVMSTDEIMKDLRRDTTTINQNLSALNARALALENLVLPNTLTLTIKDIHYLAKKSFTKTAQTKTYTLTSSPLHRNLKEMNRNSHNFVAEMIFRKLSQDFGYDTFFRVKFPFIPADEVKIYNGSGYPVVINGNKTYNEASCRTVVEVMSDMRNTLLKQGLEFKHIMAVAGKDAAADGDSTVTQIYGANETNGALIAKTGSVADTIALAGMISTADETTFFHTSFDTENTPADRQQAYGKIKDWLINRLKGKKKSDLDQYVPKSFLPFDKSSPLVPVAPGKLQ